MHMPGFGAAAIHSRERRWGRCVDEVVIQRLKQRKMVQWALAYLAGAFALLQVSTSSASASAGRSRPRVGLIVARVIGSSSPLVLAWYHGERGAQRVSGTELSILALLLTDRRWLAVARGSGARRRRAGGCRESGAAKADAATASVSVDEKSIAVLPLVEHQRRSGQRIFLRRPVRGIDFGARQDSGSEDRSAATRRSISRTARTMTPHDRRAARRR